MKGQACSFFDPKGGAFEFTARIFSVGMNFMAKRAVSDLYFPSFAIVTSYGGLWLGCSTVLALFKVLSETVQAILHCVLETHGAWRGVGGPQ